MELGLRLQFLYSASLSGPSTSGGDKVVNRQSKFFIRKAQSEDATGILECLRAAFEDYRERYTAEAFSDTVLTPETLATRLAKMCIFVALGGSHEVVGTIACNVVQEGQARPTEGHVRGMAVLPSWHGAGLAAQLLQQAERELRSLGCVYVTLDTTPPLDRAMRFYEKNGFCRSGKVADFFGMPLIEYRKAL
jgi:predicted N-acetyltransferase YhbS